MKNNPMLKLGYQYIFYWSIIVILINLFASCASSKHKETKKEEVKIELSENDKSKNETTTDTLSKKEVDVNKENTSKTNQTIYEGKKGDSLTVIEENLTTGEKMKTTYVGSGKLLNSTKTEHTTESVKEKIEDSSSSKIISESENNLNLKASAAASESSKNKESNSYYWIWIILLIIGVLLWYLNKRFKWIFKLKNYVTTLFN